MKKNLNGLILKESHWKDHSIIDGVMTNQLRGDYNSQKNSSKNGYNKAHIKRKFRYERI